MRINSWPVRYDPDSEDELIDEIKKMLGWDIEISKYVYFHVIGVQDIVVTWNTLEDLTVIVIFSGKVIDETGVWFQLKRRFQHLLKVPE